MVCSAQYFDGLSSASIPVVLRIEQDYLRIEGTGIKKYWAVSALDISEKLGNTPRIIRHSTEGFCEVTDLEALATMLHASGTRDRWIDKMQHSFRGAVFSLFLILAFFGVSYQYGLPVLAKSIAMSLPVSSIKMLDAGALDSLDKMFLSPSALPLDRQRAISDGFAKLISPQDKDSYHLVFRKSPAIGPNAFALPSGTIVLLDELVALSDNDEEIYGVLGHELGHVQKRHGVRMLLQTSIVGLAMTWWLGDVSSILAAAPATLIGAKYSRDMEREADRIGFGVLSEAGYDPRGFVTMFGKLQQAAGVNDNGAFPYLRSHPLTTERIADMHSRLPLGVAVSSVPHDMEQAMVSARARVLSQSQVDSLRAWTQLPQSLPAQATPAQKAGSLYAAALAHQMLREPAQARQQWQALQTLTASHTAAARLTRLLGADLQAARGEYAQLVQGLQPSSMVAQWPRPELVTVAQALAHLPDHPATASVLQQLRQQVQTTPHDAQAWNLLGTLQAAQGQKLASLRAEGEAQLVRMDLQGALDRFRAAQDVARSGQHKPGDHIEASIVDTRVRQIQEQLRELQKER